MFVFQVATLQERCSYSYRYSSLQCERTYCLVKFAVHLRNPSFLFMAPVIKIKRNKKEKLTVTKHLFLTGNRILN